MGRHQVGNRKKRDRKTEDDQMGFGQWGGYMDAKRAKLMDQFHGSEVKKESDIFKDVAIHVNGLTRPPIEELKRLMAAHGGLFHAYQVSGTTHIIASNLPNVKIKQLGSVPIVKPSWITDSIDFGKLLDFRRYLLYTNQSVSQPKIQFPVIEKEAIKASTKTASDPNFLEEFYGNSRLHLISTLGAEYKQLIGMMRDKHDGKFPGKEKLIVGARASSHHLPIIMHIDMDCFFVSVGLRNRPDLKGKPVAVTHARNAQTTALRPDQKANREQEFAMYVDRLPDGVASRIDKLDTSCSLSEIASCSYEARGYGIRNGMFMGQAVKLCPELRTLQYDFEGYKEVSHTLYDTIASYTLDIEAVSCDEMYVDVTKILNETGMTVEEWASHIRGEIIAATGCPCSTGFGANRLQARLATRKAKPNGCFYLRPEVVSDFLASIPLEDLPGVGRATVAKLNGLGLSTCGDVQLYPLKSMQSTLGQKAGRTIKEQAEGIDMRPLNFQHERKSVSAEVNYGIRFKSVEEAYNFLMNLSEEVARRLKDLDMKARCVTLKLLVRAEDAPIETAKFLGHGICDSLTKSATGTILNSPEIIYKESKSLYDKLCPAFQDLRGMGIQLSKLEKGNRPVNATLSKFLNGESVLSAKKTEENVLRTKKNVLRTTQKVEVQNVEAKGRRGRPKGSRGNGKMVSEGTRGVHKFFTKTKGLEVCNKVKPPSAEQIDPSVLNELPEEIRQEIIQEYQLQYTAVEPKIEKPAEAKKASIVPKSPFFNLDWEDLKGVLKQWTNSADKPEEIDQRMFAGHLRSLALDGKIEYLLTAFNFLHRIFSRLNCEWHKAYYYIHDTVQEGILTRYEARLAAKREFNCCKS